MADDNLSSAERRQIKILLVEPDGQTRSQLHGMLATLGFAAIQDTSDHGDALRELNRAEYAHLIFSTASTSLDSVDFFSKSMIPSIFVGT